MFAWKMTGSHLEDGTPVPAFGALIQTKPPVRLGMAGIHASLDAFDSLQSAHGATLHFVRMSGQMVTGHGMVTASECQFLARMDAGPLLDDFARWCAVKIADTWDAPQAVWSFLEGVPDCRDECRAAAWGALALDHPPTIRNAIKTVLLLSAPEGQLEPWLLAQMSSWNQMHCAADGLDGLAWSRARSEAEKAQREYFDGLVGRALSVIGG